MFVGLVGQTVRLRIRATDDFGNPAPLDGVPVWSVSDPAFVVTPDENGMAATVVLPSSPMTGQISVTADARLGEEVKNITGLLDVEVRSGEATQLFVEPEPTA